MKLRYLFSSVCSFILLTGVCASAQTGEATPEDETSVEEAQPETTAAPEEAVDQEVMVPQSIIADVDGDGNIEIDAFGDSITRGVGDFTRPGETVDTGQLFSPTGEAGYPLRIERFLGIGVSNLGVPGEVFTTEGLPRFARIIPRRHPDIVIISGGSNDVISRIAPGDYQRAAQTMINISYAIGTRPVLATIPPACCNHSGFTQFTDTYNRELRTLATANEIVLADIFRAYDNTCPRISECSLLNLPEGEHPNTSGYDVSGEAVAAALLQINLFNPDGPLLLSQAIGVPVTDIKTRPDSVASRISE